MLASSLHVTLLSDFVRTASYRSALERHAQDRTLLEIGCGSGALACFAVRAGAKRVYAIEQSAIIDVAREVARLNGCAERIIFIPGNSMEVDLDERVDVIYSELLSSDPFGQQMFPVLRDAAQRFLRPGGRLIPSHLEVHAVGIESSRFANRADQLETELERVEQLGPAYELDLSPLTETYREHVERRWHAPYEQYLHEDAAGERLLTEQTTVASYELATLRETGTERVHLDLEVIRTGTHNGMTTSFAARLDEQAVLSTSPLSPQRLTCWSQIARPLLPVEVHAGERTAVFAELRPFGARGVSYRR